MSQSTPPLSPVENRLLPTSIWVLPDEVTIKVFGELDVASALTASRVCSQWHNLIQDGPLWFHYLGRDFGFRAIASNENPREVYKNHSNIPSRISRGVYRQCTFVQPRDHSSNTSSPIYADGKFIYTLGRMIIIWDLFKGTCLQELEGYDGDTQIGLKSTLAYANGRLASTFANYLEIRGKRNFALFTLLRSDTVIKVWDTETGDCLQTLKGHESSITHLEIKSDGRLTSYDGLAFKTWDMDKGTCLRTLNASGKSLIAYDAGKLFFDTADNKIVIHNIETETSIQTSEGHPGAIVRFEFANEKLISVSKDGTIKIWETDKGTCVCTIEAYNQCPRYYIADGKLILASGIGIEIWDIETGTCLKKFKRSLNPDKLDFLGYSDGKFFTRYSGSLRIWSVNEINSSLSELFVKSLIGKTGHLAGKILILTASDGDKIHIWDIDKCVSLTAIDLQKHILGYPRSISFADGKLVVTHECGDLSLTGYAFQPSAYSLMDLQENLEIIKRMAHSEQNGDCEDVAELAKGLHPDFQRRLNASSVSKNTILHVQAEIHVELLIYGIFHHDLKRINENLNELDSIKDTAKLYELLWRECGCPDVTPLLEPSLESFILSKEEIEQAVAELSVEISPNAMEGVENAMGDEGEVVHSRAHDSQFAEMFTTELFQQDHIRSWGKNAFCNPSTSDASSNQLIQAVVEFKDSREFIAIKEDSSAVDAIFGDLMGMI